MLSDADFKQICAFCNIEPLPLPSVEASSLKSENSVSEMLLARSTEDRVALNFLAAGASRNFTPALIKAERMQAALRYSFSGSPLSASYRMQHRQLEEGLLALSSMEHCSLFSLDLVSVLATLLTSDIRPGKVLIAATVAPVMRETLRTLLKHCSIELVVLDYDKQTGTLSTTQLQSYGDSDISALIVAWPNFFSLPEDLASLSGWLEKRDAALVVLTEVSALALLETPCAVPGVHIDFMLGDLAALGLPANRYGAAPSFLLSKRTLSRKLDEISQSQTLGEMSQLAGYLSLLAEPAGLQGLARRRELMQRLLQKLCEIRQISIRFSSPHLFECVIRIQGIDLENARRILSGHNILPGYFLENDYPELQDSLLLSCSDLHNEADIDKFAGKIAIVVKNLSTAGCPVKPKF